MLQRLSALLLMLVVLAGCGAGEPAAPTTGTARGTPTTGATGTSSLRLDLQDLINNQITSIDTAIGANDLEEARAQLEGFNELWTLMQADIAAVSADAAAQIETDRAHLESVLMGSDAPSAADVTAATEALRNELEAFINSLP